MHKDSTAQHAPLMYMRSCILLRDPRLATPVHPTLFRVIDHAGASVAGLRHAGQAVRCALRDAAPTSTRSHMTSTSTAASRNSASDAAHLEVPLQHADLAQLDGHAARCVGAMLSAMVGDVLGGPALTHTSCIASSIYAPVDMK